MFIESKEFLLLYSIRPQSMIVNPFPKHGLIPHVIRLSWNKKEMVFGFALISIHGLKTHGCNKSYRLKPILKFSPVLFVASK
ncbi:MAG TPA: hypothetical protein DDW50_22255 [Firmicutes bacterium]|nr:hypothetical protein [Bacillota bacterium]